MAASRFLGVAAFAIAILGAVGAMAADKVSVGYTPNWSPCANIAIALEKTNICEKNGLECEVISFVAGAPQMEAMLAGKLDIALVGDAPSIAFAARGGKGRWVAKLQDYRGALMARKDSDINTISDLKGRKVAAYISSAVYAQLYHALLEAGLNPVRDIKLVNLRPADWVPALRRNEIDAFMAWDPVAAIASFEPDMKIVREGMGPGAGVVVISDAYLEKNRDAAVRFLMAYKEAVLYMATHKDQVNNWLAESARLPVKAVYEASKFDHNYANAKTMSDVVIRFSDAEIKGIQGIADFLDDLKQIRKAPDVREYMDMSLLDEAEKRMGNDYDPSTVKPK